MASNPYLLRTAHPEDCVCVHGSGTALEVRDFFLPVEDIQKDEITCMMFHELADKPNINYHQHTSGNETFIPISGKIEIIAQGIHTYMIPGDIFHVQPYMSHGFRALEKDSAMMCLFQGFDMINLVNNRIAAQRKHPDVINDPAYRAAYNKLSHKLDREVPDPIERPREEVFCLRREGTGLFEYRYPGVDLYLKVGRWETHGLKEIWEADMKKGVRVEWGEIHGDYRLFFINKGVVDFTIDGDKFTIDEEALVRVPPLLTFSLECQTDARVYDLDCPDFLHSMLEELGDPQKERRPKDPEKLRELKDKFSCSVTSYSYK
jgi:quercetin dioxygenase-like cupin family protein